MGDSQQAAASTAETAAGLPVRMRIGVAGVPKGSPAAGRLREGDLVTRITANGVTTQIAAYADLGSVLKKTPPGTTVNIGFTRDGKARPDGSSRGPVWACISRRRMSSSPSPRSTAWRASAARRPV